VTGDCHARFEERRRVKFPPPTHHTQVHHGFRIERQPDGTWHTYRPDGTEILIYEPLQA
jgi:hypothetical protein